jgi:GNAT superfamily N-acetyltransferase
MSATARDLLLRPALPRDYLAWRGLFPELEVDDPVMEEERWQAELMPFTWVAVREGAVLGYVFCQPLDDRGYVRQVVVAPGARGQGIARALMQRAAGELRAAGIGRWCLNVKPENAAALRLYRGLGLGVRYHSHALRLPWTLVDALAADDEPASVRTLTAADDEEIARRFALPAGQLARARERGRLLFTVAAAPEGPPLGFAVFDPGFPGAFPFRVQRPALAAPLLRALRTHARDLGQPMGLVVEDDPALARLLLAAGASLRHEVLHMDGPLPPAPQTP